MRGIAKTVKLLLDRLGVESVIALSHSNPEKGIKYRHAWNLVKLKNVWYHLDATFDNSLGRYGEKRFDYYNLDDKAIFRDHQPLVYPMPACGDSSLFYYKEKRLVSHEAFRCGGTVSSGSEKEAALFCVPLERGIPDPGGIGTDCYSYLPDGKGEGKIYPAFSQLSPGCYGAGSIGAAGRRGDLPGGGK